VVLSCGFFENIYANRPVSAVAVDYCDAGCANTNCCRFCIYGTALEYRDPRLSSAAVSDIAILVELRMREQGSDSELLSQIAGDTFSMSVAFLPGESLPETETAPIVALLHQSLSRELTEQIGRPFWLDTVTYDNYVDIRVLLPGEVMRVLTQRKRVYATNSHIFMIWMVGTSVILLMVSGVFLRNQIRPIQRLAEAAEEFGKGRDTPEFRPAGASEVRRAAASFIEMRDRIQRQIEQRTTMLAGVSHDLRTPLTRLKLQMAMMPQTPDVEELNSDISEMEDMLDDYLAFARGYQGESTSIAAWNHFEPNPPRCRTPLAGCTNPSHRYTAGQCVDEAKCCAPLYHQFDQ